MPKSAPASLSSGSYPAEYIVLAVRILFHSNISFAKKHVSGKQDDAVPLSNLIQAVFLHKATRSCYGKAPCGEIQLSLPLLRGMLELAKTYRYSVTEIAGGEHSKNSRHYQGVAFDVDSINDVPVSSKNKHAAAFQRQCKALGATEVLGPGDKGHAGHVHCAWPRPK